MRIEGFAFKSVAWSCRLKLHKIQLDFAQWLFTVTIQLVVVLSYKIAVNQGNLENKQWISDEVLSKQFTTFSKLCTSDSPVLKKLAPAG